MAVERVSITAEGGRCQIRSKEGRASEQRRVQEKPWPRGNHQGRRSEAHVPLQALGTGPEPHLTCSR